MTENKAQRGRRRLLEWQANSSANFYSEDQNLREVLHLRLGSERLGHRQADFDLFGESAATIVDEATKEMQRVAAYPTLRRYDGIGQRIEQVEFHPNYHGIGQTLYATGVLSDYDHIGQEAAQLVFAYLFTQNGEAGHACPLACAAGLIKILQAVGSEELKSQFLPRLLDPNYGSNFQASQFLTEVQGGSDVGANAVEARPNEDGSYSISGEKWFCSVANADVFLMTARPTDAPEGTRGLGAFLVPRLTEEGEPNGFAIRRLKDKLGTRFMASAEIDFDGAKAWPIGPVDQGFKNVVEIVLTTSRLYNAVSCAGIMRRAMTEAFGFAKAREAFGQSISRFPLVKRSLARLKVESAAALSSTMALVAYSEKSQSETLTETETQFFRAAVPMNKMLTALRGTQMVHEAMEVFGGNGAIESFSVLPRLYRDSYILEAWEGTHNVLTAQFLKDCAKYQVHKGLLQWCEDVIKAPDSLPQKDCAGHLESALENQIKPAFQELEQSAKSPMATLIARDLLEKTMVFIQAVTLLQEARHCEEASELSATEKTELLAFFCQDHGFAPAFDGERMARSLAILTET
ncbi:MAG: acyl-CoA dehydrogenase family protein [Planctomycetota bacterium]|nr:acyl-CoA dehydrogenase family protein [Planctomycetota bacterium]